MDQRFDIINCGLIRPNPKNPRSSFEGDSFNNLVASIREKGVLEPILVRPVDGNGTFELVAGERRLRASREAGMETIPAIIRIMDDDAAFEVMTIENLQREDISEIDEARSFKAWLDARGEKAIPDLAKKLAISPQYIRRRVRLLALPHAVLKAWETGDITYSHLEELCRVADQKRLGELLNSIVSYDMSTKRLRAEINRDMIDLGKALFDAKPCKKCAHNTIVQRELFGFDFAGGKKGRCTDPACFKKEQNNWLLGHWTETAAWKKYGTNGFRFYGSAAALEHGHYAIFEALPFNDCAVCDKYITVIDIYGTPVYPQRACLDPVCFRSHRTAAPDKGKTGANKHAYHGREFRERFYRQEVPLRLARHTMDTSWVLRMAIAAMIEHCQSARHFFKEKYAAKTADYWFATTHAWSILEAMDYDTLAALLKEMSALSLVTWGGDQDLRDKVAVDMGIDLERDWRITREYLQAKTIPEIITIGRALSIFDDPIAKDYLAHVLRRKSLEACKKTELVSLVLESGIDLAGKVPAEILELGERAGLPLPAGEPGNFCEYCGNDMGDADECETCSGKEDLEPWYCIECGTHLDEKVGSCPRCDG